MILKKVQLSSDSSVYLMVYLHEDVPKWDYGHPRPAVLVCPGGGYGMCSPREADPIAMQYLAAGFNAFVLYYSLGEHAAFPGPLLDLSGAIKLIRSNSEEWNIIPDQIAVCGFSAGGHLAASLATLWNNSDLIPSCGGGGDNKPNALILAYPVITTRSWMKKAGALPRLIGNRDQESTLKLLDCSKNVGPHTPRTFLFHTFRDNAVAVEESLCFANALTENDIPFELHIYPNGPHGIALANEQTGIKGTPMVDANAATWMQLSIAWLKRLFENPEENSAPILRAKQEQDE